MEQALSRQPQFELRIKTSGEERYNSTLKAYGDLFSEFQKRAELYPNWNEGSEDLHSSLYAFLNLAKTYAVDVYNFINKPVVLIFHNEDKLVTIEQRSREIREIVRKADSNFFYNKFMFKLDVEGIFELFDSTHKIINNSYDYQNNLQKLKTIADIVNEVMKIVENLKSKTSLYKDSVLSTV